MPLDELSGPDLAGVVADAKAAGLEYVVIGGFSVIYHGHVRATKDSDLLVPDGSEADAAILRFLKRTDAKRLRDNKILTPAEVADAPSLRLNTRHGIVDLMRGGLPPWTSRPSPRGPRPWSSWESQSESPDWRA